MSVHVIDTIKPKNNGSFPVVEAVDVKVTDSKRLDAALNDKANQSDLTALQTTVAGKASQADLTALSETVSGKQNALTEEQLTAVNSGITSALVTQIGTNTTAIAGKASQSDLEITNAAVATKANASEVTAETENLQAQIDNIVSGSTEDSEVINARVNADGVTFNTLKARCDNGDNNTKAISNAIPQEIVLTNQTVSTEGVISDNNTRVLSGVAHIATGDYIKLKSGYEFRMAIYSDASGSTFVSLQTDWRTEATFSSSANNSYRRFIFRKTDGSAEVTPDEVRANIDPLTTVNFPFEYTLIDDISSIETELSNTSASLIETESIVDSIDNEMPTEIVLTRQAINTEGVISDSTTSALSAIVRISEGDYIKLKNGYEFRAATYSDATGETFIYLPNTWSTEVTYSSAAAGSYRRFQIRKTNGGTLTLDEARQAIDSTTTVSFEVEYSLKSNLEKMSAEISVMSDEISDIQDELQNNEMNLNISLTGRDNQMWSYTLSLYPLCQAFKRVRNCVYWGYTTSEGYSGIACYNLEEKTFKKTHLKKSDIDDHNPCVLLVRDNGDIIISYSGGHNTDEYIHVRKSTTPECIDRFDDDRNIYIGYPTSYSQIFEYDNAIWIFFRYSNTNWGFIKSTDGGETWTSRKNVVNAGIQYYCKFQKTTTPGRLRLCMYSNPDASDKNIRMGFLDLATGKIYNSDNTTELGTIENGVQQRNFDIIIAEPETGKQRLLDVAVTEPAVVSILFCQWTTDVDGVYKWYNNGSVLNICDCGQALWGDKYQGGAAFLDTSSVVLSRGELGVEYIEIWTLSALPSKAKEIYSETKGTIPIRNCRPIVSPDGKALLWHRGYYNKLLYTDFNSDAKLYLVDDDIVI